MDVSTLKAKISHNQIPSYILMTGDEWKVQEIYIKQIAKVVGKDIKRIDSIADIYASLKNRSFVQKSYVYVVRDDRELINNVKLKNIEDVLGDNILIHLLTKVDKRTKFYTTFKDKIIEFNYLEPAILKKYIKKEINLSDRNCDLLIDICEQDYGRILLEIDKIKRYRDFYNDGSSNEVESNQVLEWLLKDGTIYEPPYDAIFDLVDAILDKKVNLTFDLLQQSYEVGEATMVMLSVLYNNVKAVFQVQTYEGNNLSKATGLTGWQIKNAKKHIGKYTIEELEDILKLIHKVSNGIKTGKLEDEFVMQYVLVKIFA